ncbi:DUF4124 domain-containing protein [Psychromonas sp. KJ10-10]|uniref:DUF4124 domain-containing protein n=1 Tax=Psychromonas sp. KJ10-10 TaxID=3391823 RepID=UPI0039B47331
MLLFVFTAPLYAEVYQCDIEGVAHFSNTPCDNPFDDLELGDVSIDEELYQQEQFVIPDYPGWKNGWEKTKNIKLSRFSEIEYKPLRPSSITKNMLIAQQKLTDLPESMTAQRFAISVQDIIQSICVNSVHFPVNAEENDAIFYGHYACTLRRDTKQGEMGYYKIMRGENSLYMLAIKWQVASFSIGKNQFIPILETDENENKVLTAREYLHNDVKLCRAGECF